MFSTNARVSKRVCSIIHGLLSPLFHIIGKTLLTATLCKARPNTQATLSLSILHHYIILFSPLLQIHTMCIVYNNASVAYHVYYIW